MSKKPHIIIFNPDEMRADALGHLGNPAAITPNIDAFAETEAVSYSRAYCQNPVCVPSRCSFFTGLYPHDMGHRTMAYLLHPGEKTLFSELKDNGYYVWMNSRNDLFAGQYPGWPESNADEVVPYGVPQVKNDEENPNLRGEPGSKYYYSHFHGRLRTDENGVHESEDDRVVNAAVERIKNPPGDQPMCIFMGLLYPHVPYEVEEPYYSAIDRKLLPPRVRLEDCTGKSKMIHKLHEYVDLGEFTEEDWDELRAVYLGMCMKVDAQFGKVLDALKEAGIYDDCAIFFISDHGDWAGDFGLPEKAQSTFEDCITRVPLLIKPPKDIPVEPGICDSLTELIDFYGTVMDLAGVEPSYPQFGRSLRETFTDHEHEIRPFVCCEGGRNPDEKIQCSEYRGDPADEYFPKQQAQWDDEAHAKATMLRNDRYKYVSRTTGEDELYDMAEDPHETCNLIDDPEYAGIVTEMQRDMLKWLQETEDTVPYESDQRWSRDMMISRASLTMTDEQVKELEGYIDQGIPYLQAIRKVNG